MLEAVKCRTSKACCLPSGSGAHRVRAWELYFHVVCTEMRVIFSGSQKPKQLKFHSKQISGLSLQVKLV